MNNFKDLTKNIAIGLFAVIAIVIIAFSLLYFQPSVGDKGQAFLVRFADIDKINVGTRVTFAGRPVGEVEKITTISDFQADRHEYKGVVYSYELLISVDSSVTILDTDTITIVTSGLMGTRSVGILPMPPKNDSKSLEPMSIIYAKAPLAIEQTLEQVGSVVDSAQQALNAIVDVIEENRININQSTSEAAKLLSESHVFVQQLNESNILVNLKHATDAVAKAAAQLDTDKGTIGKLLHSDDLYLGAVRLTNKLDVLLNDINHYGIMFHLNKGWQRTRSKRMNEAAMLQNPTAFKAHFSKELDQIATSTHRIMTLLDKAQCTDPNSVCPKQVNQSIADLRNRLLIMEQSLQSMQVVLIDDECD